MIKSLRKRFVFFNMLVIGIILVVLSLLVFLGSKSTLSTERLVITILVSLVLVFVGSFLLSKIAITPIKDAWQKQLDFTADASHELRTPIAVIQTNLELVMDNREDTVESQMKWLQNIQTENKRMTRLVEDLLTLSRADTNQQSLDRQTFLLDELIKESLAPFEPLAADKDITLSFTASASPEFYGDRSRIKQLLVILVDNALKYTDSGRVDVTLGKDERFVKLTVSDTGSGIEQGHLDKIFDRFYRVTKTRNQNQDGSGLGLSIVKWIVQEHGGAIKVESEFEIGTTFTVLLPLER